MRLVGPFARDLPADPHFLQADPGLVHHAHVVHPYEHFLWAVPGVRHVTRLQQGREDRNVFSRLWKGLRNLPSDESNSSNSRSIFDRLRVPKALPDLKDKT